MCFLTISFANCTEFAANLRLLSAQYHGPVVLLLLLQLVCAILLQFIYPIILNVLTCFAEEKDLVIIGGGVAGYVAAIKAGQEGMKV